MDVLFPAIYSALTGDSELDAATSVVRQFRQPQEPKKLQGALPVVVFRPKEGPDEVGLHGAATNVEVEVSVWAYGANEYPEAVVAAQRISEIFIGGISLSSGGHTRWGELLGWQQIDQDDPDVVLLRATFGCRYWSSGRVAAAAAAV